jgi:hypothetical protein
MNAIDDIQTPFMSKGLDMPGLSYVCGASELALRMIVGPVDKDRLTQMCAAPRRITSHHVT